jgi:hypothetical protein
LAFGADGVYDIMIGGLFLAVVGLRELRELI